MSATRLACGPFELDRATHVVRRDGEPLALGLRAALILEALLTRPGDVVTKSELLDAAWAGAAVEESNLSVQVAALRKALGGAPDGGEWIVTVPRVGYRLAASAGDTAVPAPQDKRPAIAVLPFANLSSDPEQAFFADGLAEEIITSLSKLPELLVIARNSSFAYRGSDVDVRKVAGELDVSHILTGSVRRSADRIRISVQLAEGSSGGHLWADRYDQTLTDVFAIQDEITGRVVEALRLTLGPSATAVVPAGGTRNIEALDCVLRARAMHEGPQKNPAVFRRMCEFLRRAIVLDPNYADAYAALTNALSLDFVNRWTDDPDGSLAEARRLADTAITVAPGALSGHLAANLTAMMAKDFARADRELDIAERISPGHPAVFSRRGDQCMRREDPDAAIAYFERAMRLEPGATLHYLQWLGIAYFQSGRFETAAALFRERLLLMPQSDMSRSFLVSIHGHLGEPDDARRIHAELMAINPKYDLVAHISRLPVETERFRTSMLEGWRKAGLRDD